MNWKRVYEDKQLVAYESEAGKIELYYYDVPQAAISIKIISFLFLKKLERLADFPP